MRLFGSIGTLKTQSRLPLMSFSLSIRFKQFSQTLWFLDQFSFTGSKSSLTLCGSIIWFSPLVIQNLHSAHFVNALRENCNFWHEVMNWPKWGSENRKKGFDFFFQNNRILRTLSLWMKRKKCSKETWTWMESVRRCKKPNFILSMTNVMIHCSIMTHRFGQSTYVRHHRRNLWSLTSDFPYSPDQSSAEFGGYACPNPFRLV